MTSLARGLFFVSLSLSLYPSNVSLSLSLSLSLFLSFPLSLSQTLSSLLCLSLSISLESYSQKPKKKSFNQKCLQIVSKFDVISIYTWTFPRLIFCLKSSGAKKDSQSQNIARTAPKYFLNNSRWLPVTSKTRVLR